MDVSLSDYFINTLFSVPMTLLAAFYVVRMLSFRNKWVYVTGYTLATVLVRLACRPLGLFYMNVAEILLVFLAVYFLSDDKPAYRLFVSAVALVIMFAAEILALSLLRSLGTDISADMTHLFANPGVYLFVHVVELAILWMLYVCFERLWRRIVRRNGETDLLAFMIFPLDQSLLLWFGTMATIQAGSSQANYLWLCALLAISAVADVAMFLALKRLRLADAEKQRAAFLETQMEQQKAYYDHIVREAEATAKVRHDIRNQLSAAYSLMAEGNADAAKEMLSGIGAFISAPQKFCDNRVVNVVMNEKAEICRSAGIALNCSIALDDAAGISGMELCSLFTNVMDNAVSGCRASGAADPAIALSAFVRGDYLILNCRNTAAPAETKHANAPLAEHGWGLLILKDIAARRDGMAETRYRDGIFETNVYLKRAAPEQPDGR